MPLWFFFALLLFSGRADAQDTQIAQNLQRLGLEDLLDIDITSVSRKSEPLSQTAAAVEVITGEDLRRYGVTTIPEALRLFTGLQVSRFNSGSWAISARGFTTNASNKLLVMIDGRTVYSPLFSGTFWELQDSVLEDIERIEVVRGPGATLWGANAVNGVINVVTKSATRTEGGFVRLGGGGREDLAFATARWGDRIGKNTSYRVFSKYSYRDQLEFSNGTDAKDPFRAGRAGFRLDSNVTSRDAVTVEGDGYKALSGILGREDAQESGGDVLTRWTRTFSDRSDMQLRVYVDHTNRYVQFQSGERRTTADFDLQYRFPWKKNDIVVGAGYRVSGDDTDTSPELSTKFVPSARTLTWSSAFVQDEISLVPSRASLTIGSKFEHNTYSGWEFQPSARLALEIRPAETLWGAVTRAIRSPSRFDTDIRFTPPPFLFQGNPDFKSETVNTFEAGFRTRLRSRLAMDVATFYSTYDNLRSPESQANPLVFITQNDMNAKTYGGEVTMTYDLTEKWRLSGGYSRLRKTFSMDNNRIDPFKGSLEGNDAGHAFTIRSSMDLPRNFEFDGLARFTGALPNPKVPRFFTVDARFGWSPTRNVELSLSGRNLGDAGHPEFSTEEIQRDIYGAVNIRF